MKVDLSYALWMRIKFVRNLFQLMQNTDEHQYFVGLIMVNSFLYLYFIYFGVMKKTKSAEDVIKYINNCLEALAKFEDTNKLGAQPEYIKNGKTGNTFL